MALDNFTCVPPKEDLNILMHHRFTDSPHGSSRMLKPSASGVLASLSGLEVLEDILRSPRSILRANGHTKCGWYLLASSLAAALLDGIFEHPETIETSAPYGRFMRSFVHTPSFSAAC